MSLWVQICRVAALCLLWLSSCNAFVVSNPSPSLFQTTRLPSPQQENGLKMAPEDLWTSYNIALQESPLLVKSLTAGVILGAADVAGQAIESARTEESEDKTLILDDDESTPSFDLARALRFAVFGLVLQAVRMCDS